VIFLFGSTSSARRFVNRLDYIVSCIKTTTTKIKNQVNINHLYIFIKFYSMSILFANEENLSAVTYQY